MRDCDIWVDREPDSCRGAPEKSPHWPFILFPIENKKRQGDCSDPALLGESGERIR